MPFSRVGHNDTRMAILLYIGRARSGDGFCIACFFGFFPPGGWAGRTMVRPQRDGGVVEVRIRRVSGSW